jgi:hypothetical protein
MSGDVTVEIESDLVQAFRARDRKVLYVPDTMRFPLKFEHYMTWSDPVGMYQYVLFRKHGREELVGMVFDRSDAGQAGRTQMCCWCQSTGPSDQIDMLTVKVDSRTLVGVVLCIDLSCLDKLENTAKLSKKSHERLARDVVDRMTLFYERKFEVWN